MKPWKNFSMCKDACSDLVENARVKTMKCGCNYSYPNPYKLECFHAMLPTFINLREISVYGCISNETGVVLLMKGLSGIATLKVISLSWTYMGLDEVKAILDFFEVNRSISGLAFLANHLKFKTFHTPGDVQQALLEGLAKIPALKSLASISIYLYLYVFIFVCIYMHHINVTLFNAKSRKNLY